MTDHLRAFTTRNGQQRTSLVVLTANSKGGYVLRAGDTETHHTDRRTAFAGYDAAFAAVVAERKAAQEFQLKG